MIPRFFCVALAAATLRAFAADTPELRVYFGNLHSHTSYSDGAGTPEKAYAYARDAAHLDFLAITEHNHLLGGSQATPEQRAKLYAGPDAAALIPTAKRFTEDGKFVALHGQEFSTMSKGNHVNVFDVPVPIDVESGAFDKLLDWMRQHPDSTGRAPVLQLNHPALGRPGKNEIGPREFGRDDFGGDTGWVAHMGAAASLIEVLNGEPPLKYPGTRAPQVMDNFYLLYLQAGFHVAPTGDQDNHHVNWGTATSARTGIIAPALTTRDMLDAMRTRHVYATEDKNLRVIARVNGQLCGDILSAPAGPAKIEVQIRDDDEPGAGYTVDVFRGEIGGAPASIAATKTFRGDTPAGEIDGVELSGPKSFLFLRITQSGDPPDRVWTAPVWNPPGS